MLPIKNNLRNKSFSKRGKTHYGSKRYSNPFFQSRRRKKLRIDPLISWKIKIVLIAILVAISAVVWLILYSQFFTIKNVNVSGEGNNFGPEKLKEIAEQQINNNMFILWPQKNIFLYNEASLKANIENRYSFDKLEIRKKLPNSLSIIYIEKKHSIIWQEDDRYYYADKTGIITTETNPVDIQQKDYPLLNNQSSQKIENNHVKIDEKYLAYALNLFDKLKLHEDEFTIDRFIIDDDLNTVKVALLNGPRVYFNINEGIDKQVNKLLIIKKEKIKENFNNKSYIDVRIGDSVYYR